MSKPQKRIYKKKQKYCWTKKDKILYSIVYLLVASPLIFLFSYKNLVKFFQLFLISQKYYLFYPNLTTSLIFISIVAIIPLRFMFYLSGDKCRKPFKEWMSEQRKSSKSFFTVILVVVCVLLSIFLCLKNSYYLTDEGYYYKDNKIFKLEDIEKVEIKSDSIITHSIFTGGVIGEKFHIIVCDVYVNDEKIVLDSYSFISNEKMYDFFKKIRAQGTVIKTVDGSMC